MNQNLIYLPNVQEAKPQELIDIDKLENEKYVIKTRFEFLLSHNGLRPYSCHGIIGPMSCGKSTLAKAIAEGCAETKRTLIWLSEENRDQWQQKIKKNLHNMRFFSEKTMPQNLKKNISAFIKTIHDVVKPSKA